MILYENPAFPFNALPSAIRDALQEACTLTAAPPEIVMLLGLSALTISARDFAVTAPTDGEVISTQIYCMGIAEKQSGKGRAYKAIFKPILEFDLYIEELRGRGIANLPQDLSEVLVNEASWPAIFEALSGTSKQVALINLDAETFLKGSIMRNPGLVNEFFDSPSRMTKRLTSNKVLRALHPTLGICLLVQPVIYMDHLRRRGASEKAIGLMDRVIYGIAGPNTSRRPVEIQTPALSILHQVLLALLKRGLSRLLAGTYSREVLEFDETATSLWRQIASSLDSPFRQNPAPRVAEKSWRIASAIHVVAVTIERLRAGYRIDDPFPPITAYALESAWQIVVWSIGETNKVFQLMAEASQPTSKILTRRVDEAVAAHQLLRTYLGQCRTTILSMNQAQNVSGLSAHKFRFVVEHFTAAGLVHMTEDRDILFLPGFFHNPATPMPIPATYPAMALSQWI